MQNRTHTCNELRITDAGKTVQLSGWMENIREVGGNLAFIVLRDFYGSTQLVAENEEILNAFRDLNKESVVSVTGIVRERDNKNDRMDTGDIEVVPSRVEVLGKCRYNALPFQIARSREADESLRLKYRYLDLRNPEVKKNIVMRCNVVSALRQAMNAEGFLEITTPILTASSPEGARDYLVPARKHPGMFYALPQAPQQFKQLLMTSGFDRYFQIAPCFRDEDARGDRSPGEFYQLDMEMAFASQEDVFGVMERVLPPVFSRFGKYHTASSAPFRRIPYLEAMERYGSDKPDLRIDLTVQDVTELIGPCGFEPETKHSGSKWMKTESFRAELPNSSRNARKKSSVRFRCSPILLWQLPPEHSAMHRKHPALSSKNSVNSVPIIWTGNVTNSAGSLIFRCMRSEKKAVNWNSATIRSRCPTEAWKF